MKYNLRMEDGYLVAFIDIIGFSAMVRENQDVDENTLGLVSNYFVFLENFFDHYSKEYKEENGIEVIFVSDSIFVATKKENFNGLIQEIEYICNQFFVQGLSFRGGIACGKLYFEYNILGTAVVNAVELEKIANMPCIIIEKELLASLDSGTTISKFFKPVYFPINSNVKESEDFLFYDFFSHEIAMSEITQYNAIFGCYADTIQENYRECTQEKHKKKWIFLAKELLVCLNSHKNIINGLLSSKENIGFKRAYDFYKNKIQDIADKML